jgi:hypothetical protein
MSEQGNPLVETRFFIPDDRLQPETTGHTPSLAWQEAKEKRKQVIAAVSQRRAQLYHRMQNSKNAAKPGFLEG